MTTNGTTTVPLNSNSPTADSPTTGVRSKEILDWTDLGKEMWSYLTGRGASIDYQFVDMHVEVPRDTGPDAARATWRLHGTLRISTSERAGADAA